jgi:hypothetical protein
LLETFVAFLASKMGAASDWLKVFFKDPRGNLKEATSQNLIKYGKMKAEGNISVTNFNLNVVVDPKSRSYSKDQLKEILSEVSKQISGHSGLAIELDKAVEEVSKFEITDIQRNQVKMFVKAGWSKDKINSIKTAFRIINLEDGNKFVEANQLMESAFNGRKHHLNRKLYNLARAGYLESFSLDLLFSPTMRSDKAISDILEYFPAAIFLDVDFLAEDMVEELIKRGLEKVPRVSIFARSKMRIKVMEEGYTQYLKKETEDMGENPSKPRYIFMLDSKIPYKIGESDSERMDLYLKEFTLTKFDNDNDIFS